MNQESKGREAGEPDDPIRFPGRVTSLRKAGWLARRWLFFMFLLAGFWSGIHFLASWCLPQPDGFFSQLLVSLLAIGCATGLLFLAERPVLRRGLARGDSRVPFGIRPGPVLFAVFSLFVLFITSWAAIYLLFTTLGWDAARGGFGGQILAFLLSLIMAYGILLPIGSLASGRIKSFSRIFSEATQRIASGDFSVNVPTFTNVATGFDQVALNLNRMTDSLRRLEDLRQGFVSNVSHEIQTPLTTILGFAQALRDPGLPDVDRERYLGYIEHEARRLSRMSDNLLKLGSLDARVRGLQAQAYRLDSQLRETILVLEPLYQAKNLEMAAEMPICNIEADQDLLLQVWTNLIQNAIKFTPQGGRITVSLALSGGNCRIEIADTGLGLSAADLPHVFDRFFRSEATRAASPDGAGLGLALVQSIVELHRGEVRVSSPGTGLGSVFTVSLPVQNKSG